MWGASSRASKLALSLYRWLTFCTCTFYLYWFYNSVLNFIATFKGLYFHTFCILPIIYQFPCALGCTLRCIFLQNSCVYFLIIEIPKNSTSIAPLFFGDCFRWEIFLLSLHKSNVILFYKSWKPVFIPHSRSPGLDAFFDSVKNKEESPGVQPVAAV